MNGTMLFVFFVLVTVLFIASPFILAGVAPPLIISPKIAPPIEYYSDDFRKLQDNAGKLQNHIEELQNQIAGLQATLSDGDWIRLDSEAEPVQVMGIRSTI